MQFDLHSKMIFSLLLEYAEFVRLCLCKVMSLWSHNGYGIRMMMVEIKGDG